MNREDSYRDKAAKLRRRARTERNVSTRLELELLALAFDRLGDQARRNARNQYGPEEFAERRLRQQQSAQNQQQAPQEQQQQRPKRHQ